MLLQGPQAYQKLPDLADDEVIDPALFGTIEVLDGTGDTKKKWDRNNADEVADARRTFTELTAKGYTAFHADNKTGDQKGRMATFDPNAEGMILVPQIAGGV